MMPLMLLIYGRFFLDVDKIQIPYLQIAGQLLYVVIPVVAGMLLKWKFPVIGRKITYALQPLALFFLIFILGFGTYVNFPIYQLLGEYLLVLPTATALPWIGFLTAGLLAFICRRSWPEILTIAIETGIQNIGIAILVLLYSMPQPDGDIGAVMPLTVSIFTPLPLIAAYIVIKIYRGECRCCASSEKLEISSAEQQSELLQPLGAKVKESVYQDFTSTNDHLNVHKDKEERVMDSPAANHKPEICQNSI